MHCPSCRAGCAVEDTFCRRCGFDLVVPSKSLIPVQQRLPTVLQHPQLPRVAAGMGALALGVGIELLRRGWLARLARPRHKAARALPTLASNAVRELFASSENKPVKLPKGYAIHETIVYVSRVLRREE